MPVKCKTVPEPTSVLKQNPVVLAKFRGPRRANVSLRERLQAMLQAYDTVPVTWISGVPGAGKSTLVAGFLECSTRPALWFQLGYDDSDPMIFFTDLCEAAGILHPELPPLPAMRADHLTQLDRFARRFFRTLYANLGPRAVVVLDDYHYIDAGLTIHRAVAAAISEIPAGSRLIVISHSQPPPEYARAIANSFVGKITDADLRLSVAETGQVIAALKPAAAGDVAQLYDMAQGWIAGIVLLLNDWPSCREYRHAVAGDSTMFHYFAQNVLGRLEERSRQVLMQVAFFPYVDESLAEAMTGDRMAIALLAAIWRRGLFVDRHGDDPVTYKLHPLFRLYLQEQARINLAPTAWQTIVQITANRLIELNLYGDAMPLLVRLGRWDTVVNLLMQQAPRMFQEGRRVALKAWITALPEEWLERNPWLAYWRGMCDFDLQAGAAQADLARARTAFQLRHDTFGMAMTVTAEIELHMSVRRDYSGIGRLIALLEKLLATGVAFPSSDDEAAARAALFSATVAHQPNRPELQDWAEALARFLLLDLSSDSKLIVARALFLYSPISGDTALVRPAEIATLPAASDPAASPINRIWYLTRLAFASVATKTKQEVQVLFEQAREIAKKVDITLLDATIALNAAWTADSLCDREWFKREYALLQASVDPAVPLASAFLKYMQSFACYQQGDLQAACAAMEYAAMYFQAAGALAGKSLVLLSQAFLYLQSEREEDALAAVQEAMRIGGSRPRSEYLVAWVMAAYDLNNGDERSARLRLLTTLPVGAGLNLEIFLRPLTHPVVARVCAFALRENVHPTLIKQIIRQQQIRPPVRNIIEWPWRMRVYVLGRFRVEIDDNPVTFDGRTPRKPLQLLKAICAAGGEGIASHRLAEQLWPDADGDAARSAFDMTLSRLRRIFTRDTVLLDEGKVSLNPGLVWYDLWTFESTALRYLRELRARPDPINLKRMVDGLLALYPGHLLPDDPDETWLVAGRERVKHLFLRVVYDVGNAWHAAGDWGEAAAFYERVVAIEFMEEELHRRLIRSYLENEQHAAALGASRRMEHMLGVMLGAAPSCETVRLLQKIQRS